MRARLATVCCKRCLPHAVALALALTTTALAAGRSAPTQTHVVDTGAAPCGVAQRAGSVWVAVYETGTLLRIDDERGRIETRVRVGRTPCRIATGPAAVWVTLDRPGKLLRLSLGSGRRRSFPVGAGAFDVLLASESVWATSFEAGTIARMDPSSGRLQRVYRSAPKPAGLAACADRIWVGHGGAATSITSIDPVTHRIRRVPVDEPEPGWPHCVGSRLWVTAGGSLLALDARSGARRGRLVLGGTLADSALGPDGLLWVTDKERSLIHRVDPQRVTSVDSFPAGRGAFALVRAGGGMWVTSFAGSDVRRYVP
jgi:streptogramin lyase